MVGNFDVDVQHQQRVGHLFGPLPPEMRDDTAFMDRIHAYIPGWDIPKVSREMLTDHFGLVNDFLSEYVTEPIVGIGSDLESRPPLLGQRRAASLPRVSGPLKMERPNRDVGARRPTVDIDRFQIEATGGARIGRRTVGIKNAQEKRDGEAVSHSKVVLVVELPHDCAAQDITVRSPNSFPFSPPHSNRRMVSKNYLCHDCSPKWPTNLSRK
jgi:Putative ATP-dependent Lon protease